MLPPVLEVYVVHHPEDRKGEQIARETFAHFHGTAFSGLIGGSVEVYVRSKPWNEGDEAPRPIAFPGNLSPTGVLPAWIVVVVPVLSLELARALEPPGTWDGYLRKMAEAQMVNPDRVGIFATSVSGAAIHGSRLLDIFARYQMIAAPSGLSDPEPIAELRCRDLAQGIAQMILGADARLTVFISHTRRAASGENAVSELISLVRDIISETRLQHFFDASDLQPGRDWDQELRRKAASSALLAVRTDLYASRAWCQREMLIAKRAGMPVVTLDCLAVGEERGSFLMDHIPRIPVHVIEKVWNKADIRRGLNLLVDECLKRAIWNVQKRLAADRGDLAIAWWAPHAPEPVTLAQWLADQGRQFIGQDDLRILHPDPPLGPEERDALEQLLRLMGHKGVLDVMTPRALASRGA